MKKTESAWLDAGDLGLTMLTEMDMSDPTGGMDFDQGQGQGFDQGGMDQGMNEHEMGGEEVALTCDFMQTLLDAVSSQAPDPSKVQALCDGLKAAQAEKGDVALDQNDWQSIKAAAAEAFSGGGDEMGADDMGGDEYADDGMGGEEEVEECGYESDGNDEYEDRAEGDGEPAGPEGGQEHEGKTKMMDNKGGTPIGTGSTSGPGGGNTNDLSKPKKYSGKPVGTGTSGAGGSNANEFGQKPSKDGGSNNLPAYEKGSQLGAASTPFDSKAEKPAPRRSKALAAESKARGKKKIDEAIMLGMSALPGTIRDDHSNVPEDADWDDELKSIKRLSGIVEWWK